MCHVFVIVSILILFKGRRNKKSRLQQKRYNHFKTQFLISLLYTHISVINN